MALVISPAYTVRSYLWTAWKSVDSNRGSFEQYDDDGTIYTIYFYDGPEAHVCTIWKGAVPSGIVSGGYTQTQNDSDKSDFETNFKPNFNRKITGSTNQLSVSVDGTQLFQDTFDSGLDTTNNWNAPVAAGGGVAATNTPGSTALGTGTTANGYSYLQSQAKFRPVAPGWLKQFHAVNIESPVILNSYRAWGSMSLPGTPTASAPITNGICFELFTDGKLYAVAYSGGTRHSFQDLSAATGSGKQPTDTAVHKYFTYFRGDLAYWAIDSDNNIVATMPSGTFGPIVNTLQLTLLAIAGSTPPASSALLTDNAVWLGDTSTSRGIVISDSQFPSRGVTVKAAGVNPTSSDTLLTVAQGITTGSLGNGAETAVSSTAVQVLASNTGRKSALVQNTGVAAVRVGVSGVTATTGVRLAPGDTLSLEIPNIHQGAIFAIRDGSVDSKVLTQEVT